MAMLEARANDGNKDAESTLDEYRKRSKIPTEEERRKKELEFFKYKAEYDRKRQKTD